MIQQAFVLDVRPRAEFSKCGRYRWFLAWPTGRANTRAVLFIGANPSQAGKVLADGKVLSDPTASRWVNLARELHYGWAYMANARSYIATDPSGVPPDPEGIGADTDHWISMAAGCADLVVCCYGHLGADRGQRVLELVHAAGKVPQALALTKDGVPRHPRGVPASARPFPFEQGREARRG